MKMIKNAIGTMSDEQLDGGTVSFAMPTEMKERERLTVQEEKNLSRVRAGKYVGCAPIFYSPRVLAMQSSIGFDAFIQRSNNKNSFPPHLLRLLFH